MAYKNKKDENKNKREYYANHSEYFKKRSRRNYQQQKLLRKKDYNMKRQFISDYKLSHGCAICRYNKRAVALDFHHVDGDKNFGVAASMTRTFESIKSEMEKCIVLCCRCHRELHEELKKVN